MDAPPDYSSSVVERLGEMVSHGQIKRDDAQLLVARRMDTILEQLREQQPASKTSALGWLFARRRKDTFIRGLYVHGSVGRGKTMLMDIMYELAPVVRKRRCHFHEFMADVHARIHAHRQKLKNGETKQADPVPPVAASLRDEAVLLCFDEFSVTDIADAMILSRLFTELFARGCVLVTTSNVEPDNLYRDGLNRQLFLPFIDLLRQHVDIVSLNTPTDYRLEKTRSMPVWLTPLDELAELRFEQAWGDFTAGRKPHPETIERPGRSIAVPLAAGGAARFTFAELCEAPLGAADYLAIVERYDTIFLKDIPYLVSHKPNESKRFINLIDTLYDSHVRLVATAAAMPEELMKERKGTIGFEFDRTVSRLFEMRSKQYLDACGERLNI